jgi:cytochrome bd-type quinol oxidase subunit 2
LARFTAAAAVTAVLWGWAAGQYPDLVPPSVTIADAAASRTTLVTMLVSLLIGAALLVPALIYLYTLFQREHLSGAGAEHTASFAARQRGAASQPRSSAR